MLVCIEQSSPSSVGEGKPELQRPDDRGRAGPARGQKVTAPGAPGTHDAGPEPRGNWTASPSPLAPTLVLAVAVAGSDMLVLVLTVEVMLAVAVVLPSTRASKTLPAGTTPEISKLSNSFPACTRMHATS